MEETSCDVLVDAPSVSCSTLTIKEEPADVEEQAGVEKDVQGKDQWPEVLMCKLETEILNVPIDVDDPISDWQKVVIKEEPEDDQIETGEAEACGLERFSLEDVLPPRVKEELIDDVTDTPTLASELTPGVRSMLQQSEVAGNPMPSNTIHGFDYPLDVVPVTHSEQKRFQCHLCDYSHEALNHFQRHIRTHTGEKPYACHICDYRCCDSGSLKVHVRIHTGEKPYACDVCAYRSVKSQSLRRHKMTHTGEKPYACGICEYRCTATSSLKCHMWKHSDENPYACGLCDYRCDLPQTLNQHNIDIHHKPYRLTNNTVTHTRDKPYMCYVCKHEFHDSSLLRYHMKTHKKKHYLYTQNDIREKPHTCDLCDYRSRKRQDLKRHIMTHTGEGQYACSYCDYRCIYGRSFRRHMMKHSAAQSTELNCSNKELQTDNRPLSYTNQQISVSLEPPQDAMGVLGTCSLV